MAGLFFISFNINANEIASNERDFVINAAEASASSDYYCNKMMPPTCYNNDGQKIKTTPLGRPIRDEAGNLILAE